MLRVGGDRVRRVMSVSHLAHVPTRTSSDQIALLKDFSFFLLSGTFDFVWVSFLCASSRVGLYYLVTVLLDYSPLIDIDP